VGEGGYAVVVTDLGGGGFRLRVEILAVAEQFNEFAVVKKAPDEVPAIILRGLDADSANAAAEKLRKKGATVEVRHENGDPPNGG
jgi:hypothetical protein